MDSGNVKDQGSKSDAAKKDAKKETSPDKKDMKPQDESKKKRE